MTVPLYSALDRPRLEACSSSSIAHFKKGCGKTGENPKQSDKDDKWVRNQVMHGKTEKTTFTPFGKKEIRWGGRKGK